MPSRRASGSHGRVDLGIRPWMHSPGASHNSIANLAHRRDGRRLSKGHRPCASVAWVDVRGHLTDAGFSLCRLESEELKVLVIQINHLPRQHQVADWCAREAGLITAYWSLGSNAFPRVRLGR
jgi:hypothetical protein